MSWIFAASADDPAASPALGAVPERAATGSLVLLLDPSLAFVMPGLPLLHLAEAGAVPRAFSLALLEDGRLHLVHRRGEARTRLAVSLSELADAAAARIVYSWDLAAGRHVLSVEDLATGAARLSRGTGPVGLSRAEMLDACIDRRRAFGHPAMLSLAIGTAPATVCQAGGVHAGTPVETAAGIVPVAQVRAGDAVRTGDGRLRRVVAVTAERSPAIGPLRAVRLLAPYFGRSADIIVDPRQKVVVAGPDVEYLFDCEAVLADAQALVDGTTAVREDDDPFAEWYGLVFAEHDTFAAGGCLLDGRFVGRIAGAPDILAHSALAGLAAEGALPVHPARRHRVLAPWETTALAEMRRRRRAPVAA